MSLVVSVGSDAVDHIAKRLNESSWYITRICFTDKRMPWTSCMSA
jgi:hypothetical protein